MDRGMTFLAGFMTAVAIMFLVGTYMVTSRCTGMSACTMSIEVVGTKK